MSVNISKARDPRFWEKWQRSGAVGTTTGPAKAKMKKIWPAKQALSMDQAREQ